MYHKDCKLAKGIKYFLCKSCGEHKSNYENGIYMCKDCSDKLGVCQICGKSMKEGEQMAEANWGNDFSPIEVKYLDNLLSNTKTQIPLHTSIQEDCLKKFCIVSLRLQQALILGSKETEALTRVYESLMKLGRFAPVQQRGEE